MQKSDNISKPLELNKYYLVPCYYTITEFSEHTDFLCKNVEHITILYPIINHLHNDKENGQSLGHYHTDNRFISINKEHIINKNILRLDTNQIKNKDLKFNYFKMKCINLDITTKTPTALIKNSNLKNKCIHKNKCPHRGYDLSNEHALDGIITCPLHGLKFNSNTKQLLMEPKLEYLTTQLKNLKYLIIENDINYENFYTDDNLVEYKNQYDKMLKELKYSYPNKYNQIIENI